MIRRNGLLKKRTEKDLQKDVAIWFKTQYPKALWTISPAGIRLPVWIGAVFKAMGYRKGTPDMLIFEPRGYFHGALIELKMPGGTISPDQKEFRDKASER